MTFCLFSYSEQPSTVTSYFLRSRRQTILLTTSVLCASCPSSAVFVSVAVYFPAGDHRWCSGLHYLPRGEVFYLSQHYTIVCNSVIISQYRYFLMNRSCCFFFFPHISKHFFTWLYMRFFFSIMSLNLFMTHLNAAVAALSVVKSSLYAVFPTLLTLLFLPTFSCSSVFLSATR